MSSSPKGWPSNEKNDLGSGITSNFTTTPPIDPYRTGLDTSVNTVFRTGALDTAEANTGYDPDLKKNYVYATAHGAKVGDLVRFETGVLAQIEIPIVAVEANRFQIPILQGASVADTFYILRRVSMQVDQDGNLVVTSSSGPIQFVLDGVDTEVEQDTAVPANSIPLPVAPLNTAGVRVSPATETTLSAFSGKTAAGLFTQAYDQLTVTSKNASGDPLVIESRLATVLVQTATITYDIDGDFQDVVMS